MATRKPMFLTEYGGEEMATTDDMLLGGLAMTGDIAMGGKECSGVPDVPTGLNTYTSKKYVDAVAQDARPKASVLAATIGALPAYTATGSGVGKFIEADANGAWSTTDSDGVTLAPGDRFLVKDENASAADVDHGIYTMTVLGDVGTPWKFTRATDFDNDAEVMDGAHTWVAQGTAQGNSTWTLITDDPITVDTTALDFTQTQGPGAYAGGDGIDISAGIIKVDLAASNPALHFDSNKLALLLDGTTLQKGASGVSVKGLPSLFEINGSAVSSNVTAANLGILTAGPTSDADTLHTHDSAQAGRLVDELTAVETLVKGDVVDWSTTNDKVQECKASDSARVDAFAIVEEAAGIAADAAGTCVRRGPADVLTGATAGNRYFVGTAGGIVQGIGGLAAGDHIVFVGTAKNATFLEFNPQYVGRKAA